MESEAQSFRTQIDHAPAEMVDSSRRGELNRFLGHRDSMYAARRVNSNKSAPTLTRAAPVMPFPRKNDSFESVADEALRVHSGADKSVQLAQAYADELGAVTDTSSPSTHANLDEDKMDQHAGTTTGNHLADSSEAEKVDDIRSSSPVLPGADPSSYNHGSEPNPAANTHKQSPTVASRNQDESTRIATSSHKTRVPIARPTVRNAATSKPSSKTKHAVSSLRGLFHKQKADQKRSPKSAASSAYGPTRASTSRAVVPSGIPVITTFEEHPNYVNVTGMYAAAERALSANNVSSPAAAPNEGPSQSSNDGALVAAAPPTETDAARAHRLAVEIVDQAVHSVPGLRQRELLEMGRIMVASVTSRREAEMAAERAQVAADEAKVSAAKAALEAMKAAEMIRGWRAGSRGGS
ncbi:MAG: hypothetical protein M1835_000219 [Candelina submexicana]|nr:MAG: hypothetical protein M1835_000219 [Candelina submexicana]